jgi:PII-like signaling protein
MTNAQQLLIYVDENDTHGDVPLYEAVVRRLVSLEARGATVTVGIMGFGKHGRVHRKRLFGVSDDRPVVISVVDTAEKIEKIVSAIGPLVREGLMIVTDCRIVS